MANSRVNKFCKKILPALNDEPVNAHLLIRSIDIELAVKKRAEHVVLTRLLS